MIRAALIDDEKDSLDVLKYELEKHCNDIQILGQFQDLESAAQFCKSVEIDVLFIDIEMPGKTGFQFLSELESIPFELVFVTAYQNYAIRAFDFYAIDYLLKPVEATRLVRALDRLRKKMGEKNGKPGSESVSRLLESLHGISEQDKKFSIPCTDGFEIIQAKEIIYLEAAGNYTMLFLKDNKKVIATKNLKEFEDFLGGKSFMRIHNSVIVHLSKIKKYIRGDGGAVIMTNGKELPVSRSNKLRLLSQINSHM